MLIDFRTIAADTEITTDVCILGAGAAGITLARALGRAGQDVVLVESGGLELEAETQDLYAGTSTGHDYPYPDTFCRLRYFGGATNHWNGLCAPLSPWDFEARPWVPYSGWPIGRQDLDPYYARAHEVCQLGPFAYEVTDWSSDARRYHELLPSKLAHCVWQVSPPVRFGQAYREELAEARNVRVFLHANAVDIELERGAQAVRRVHLRALTGRRGTVRARRFVLALGGIENARLLLASDSVQNTGVGNGRDLVGRFFMEHPHAHCGTLLPRDPSALVFPAFAADHRPGLLLSTEFWPAGFGVRVGVTPSRAAQQRHRILNAAFMLRSDDRFTGYDALLAVVHDVRRRRRPVSFGRNVWLMMRHGNETARGLWSRLARREYRRPQVVGLYGMAEQVPNPDSRVMLADDRDALGMRRVRLEWRLSPLDRRTLRRTLLLAAEEFGRLELGRVHMADWLVDDDDSAWPANGPFGGCHHMGTTRMASDPARGVVDASCRVHDVANLYIAGSSVFPTGGFAQPTLTIVALALRLADHLSAAS